MPPHAGHQSALGQPLGIATLDANKVLVQSQQSSGKQPVRVATNAVLPAVTAAGTGPGKTLTADAVGVLTVDGVATFLGDRILVKNQVTGSDNGPYDVTTEGTGGVAFILTRAKHFDEDIEVVPGVLIPISEGTVNGDKVSQLTTNGPITVDTTSLTFTLSSGGSGDVTAAANIPDNAIVRGDGGAKGVQGDVELTFLDGLLSILVTVSLVDNRGLKLKNDNSIVAPDGWAITPGAPGIFDGNLMISSDPTDFLNNVSVRFLPGGATAFVTGAAVGDDKAFRSETSGALAYFQPRDTTGRQRTILSGVGEDGGTGHEGLIAFDVYNFGDSGLQLTPFADFVVDADYRAHADFFSLVLLKGTGGLLAGETGSTRNLVTGLQLQGQGTTNDVTIYNDAHEPVIEIPTGTKNVNFAGNIRPAGTIEENKGADIASAATLILGSDGNSFDVTGTTGITAISAKPAGTVIMLQFDGVVDITHNAVSLILEGGVAYKTEAGHTLGLISRDGINWQEIYRQDNVKVRVSGTIADQAMTRGNGGARRIQTTGNFIGDDDEIRMAGQDQWTKGANIATATALNIGVDGNLKHMTGSVGVTSINAIRTGVWVALVADAAPLFTHSASLILAGAVNFQMAAGDVLIMVDEGGGTWREISRNVSPIGGAYRRGHTYAITGEIKVPSGETDFLIPFFVDIAAGETKKIVKATYKINSGTSVTCKIQKNDSDITGFTGISVTTTKASTDPADVALAAEDKLALVVTAVSGAPTNMSFTIFIEETR